MHITRRIFLLQSAALASSVYAAPKFKQYPFSLGVMSGDPTADGFVLWTRLAPDPLNGGGMDARRSRWSGPSPRTRGCGGSSRKEGRTRRRPWRTRMHVEVTGLKPQRPYWYRFKVGTEVSPIGRCRADYRIVPFVTKSGAPVQTHSSWVVEDGKRGVQRV